jgi:Retrotransposon gag protein
MFALFYIKGGKAQYWRNEAINKIVAGHKPFKNFCDFLAKLEAQFGDPNPDATAKGKLKVMHQGAKMVDEFILEFKSEASHSNLGDVALIKYLKAGLNQSLFKSIYRLPHMPETLQEWYEWAMKLDSHIARSRQSQSYSGMHPVVLNLENHQGRVRRRILPQPCI